MRVLVPAAGAIAGASTGVLALACRFRRDMAAATGRLAAVDRQVVETDIGPVEFAEEGAGKAILVSHGIFHGCDGGLLSVRSLVEDRRVIAPSRFGYLGSALPPDATADAQADAFVAVLDHLGIDTVDVLAISAGTSAALALALRHPERVDRLVVSSGNLPGSRTAQAPPTWARVFYSDRALWALKTFVPPALSRLMGVPRGFPRTADEASTVVELLDSIFPIGPRAKGAVFDAYVSNPAVDDVGLEALGVPTLLVHAKDDPLASFDAAVRASERIPSSVLVGLDTGGHLQLGQTERVRAAVSAFLGRPATV